MISRSFGAMKQRKVFTIVLFMLHMMTIDASNICSWSTRNMERVTYCPVTLEDVERASFIKNCATLAGIQNCSDPSKFKYHCVASEEEGSFVEVCAPEVEIQFGYCATFNNDTGQLEPHANKQCFNDTPPCPDGYWSSKSYLYPYCYGFKDITTIKEMTTISSSEDYDLSHPITIAILSSLAIFSFFLGVASTFCFIRLRRRLRQKDEISELSEMKVPESSSEDKISELSEMKVPESSSEDEISELSEMKGPKSSSEDILTWNKNKDIRDTHNPMKETDEGNESTFTTLLLPEIDEISELSEMKGPESSSEEPFVIAIDIGEKYFGMAYTDPKNSRRVIPLHPMERISVLIKKPDEIVAVGSKATKLFIEMREKDFNDHVYKNEVKEKDPYKMVAGTRFQTKDILIAALKEAFNSVWAKSNTRQNKQDVKLVLSPAYPWSKCSEQLIADIFELKPPEDREKGMIFFLKKVQTISSFVHEVQSSSVCLNFNVDVLKIEKSTRYAVLNVGYDSCHLTFLHDVSDTALSGVQTRSDWGVHAPEEKVWSFCQKILDEKYINPQNHEKLKAQYDLYHEKIRKCQDDGAEFEFEFLKNDLKGNFMTKEKVDGIEIREEEERFTLRFKWKLLKECFKDLKNQVDQVIESNRYCFKMYNVKCVYLFGGYNSMDFIQENARQTWFPNITVVIPSDGGVCLAMGAASACARNLSLKTGTTTGLKVAPTYATLNLGNI